MGKPAARLGDNHVCPKVTSKVPHVGGPAVVGSPNVFINGMPAARQGDTMICVGPPDSVKGGSASVFINGKPAARMGDGTSHGGVILGGSGNVFIGDSAGPSPAQMKTMSSEAPFCEECIACQDGACAI